jgi:hypothetical protein
MAEFLGQRLAELQTGDALFRGVRTALVHIMGDAQLWMLLQLHGLCLLANFTRKLLIQIETQTVPGRLTA